MLYVAMIPIIDPEKNAKVRPAHLQYLNEWYQKGKVVMAGPFTDKQGGMVIYRAESMEEATRLAQEDPAVKEGARSLTLREWDPLAFPLE